MDANDLIGTSAPAPRQAEMVQASAESWDYYHNRPYPTWAFTARQWPPEKGPIPTALPYAQILITEGAEFVFRNGAPQFSVPPEQGEGLDPADAFLKQVIRQNCLAEQWVSLAEDCANQGAIAAKFSVDLDNADRPVRISFLDIPQECRVWFDPHDCERLLMARIQYPYRDLRTGDWYYYREEWTPDLYATYKPKLAGPRECSGPGALPGYTTHLGDVDGWELDQLVDNPFGLVPVTVIRNKRAKGNPLGVGDCWNAFRLIDRIALTLHGEDRANQLHSEPNLVVTNGEVDIEGPRLPGETLNIRNSDMQSPPADAKLLEPTGSAREYSHRSIDRWEALLYKRVGLSLVDPEAVSNKGNMTALAFAMTYARTIASSDRKRELWGESGMARFFRSMLLGLSRMGGVPEVRAVDDRTAVSCEWPQYFERTDDDRKNLTDRTVVQVSAGFLTEDRGAERIALSEGIPPAEIPDLLKELQAAREQKARERQEYALGDRLLSRFDRGGNGDDEDLEEDDAE